MKKAVSLWLAAIFGFLGIGTSGILAVDAISDVEMFENEVRAMYIALMIIEFCLATVFYFYFNYIEIKEQKIEKEVAHFKKTVSNFLQIITLLTIALVMLIYLYEDLDTLTSLLIFYIAIGYALSFAYTLYSLTPEEAEEKSEKTDFK